MFFEQSSHLCDRDKYMFCFCAENSFLSLSLCLLLELLGKKKNRTWSFGECWVEKRLTIKAIPSSSQYMFSALFSHNMLWLKLWRIFTSDILCVQQGSSGAADISCCDLFEGSNYFRESTGNSVKLMEVRP